MTPQTIERVDLNMQELEAILERARAALSEEEHRKLKAAVETLAFLTSTLEDKGTTIQRLRNLLFGPRSEKTEKVFPEKAQESEVESEEGDGAGEKSSGQGAEKKKRKGHGRNGRAAYRGAEKIVVSHESLNSGDPCPDTGCKGKVYRLREPGVIVRVVGQAPLKATVWELEKLRCNLCLTVYTAKPPAGVGEKKYDESSAAMIALLKYGSGLPFNRLERLEGNLGIPLPAATQWDIVHGVAGLLEPVHRTLIRLAAQGGILHNDDTGMKILELMGKRRQEVLSGEDSRERTGIFTSAIVSRLEDWKIALFFTGWKHAGENLESVLRQRALELERPIQMCDALSRNLPGELKTIVANCLAHARRQFIDVRESFPAECRFVLETLGGIYKNDAVARERKLTAAERMRFHREESWPHVKKLRQWLKKQLRERLVEPNSGLGKAIHYMLNHWKKLTRFLRVPGAPLDNNVAERALKKAILNRKNALFYKTRNGARVGDLFMSLIYTAELAGVDPFHYLTELQRHSAELSAKPDEWLPWNYRETLERLCPP